MSETEVLEGRLLDEACELTLAELARACAVPAEAVVELVEEGILAPRGRSVAEWRFPGPSLARARTVLRLRADLGLDLAGAALVMELLDELRRLRRRVRRLERELGW
ncbi:chaperone modulator CbpM [Inmirania thermothiophila]|uniref:MerR family transcriptional regulator n=1 Tax=Inmirania thermothiophila TaxID=1750597 RepID=A0A3N1Y6W6_9GAMM|nr:chaperone modulator CbpM [Inmirania thermothiophila]ROR34564.1 MerR family transcriptional regulator [Inmirania thermothiophila]